MRGTVQRRRNGRKTDYLHPCVYRVSAGNTRIIILVFLNHLYEKFIRENSLLLIFFFSLKLENTCEGIKNCIQKNPLINRKFGRYI